MSQVCERLHEILKEGKKFYASSVSDASVKKELNRHGLYIFYEKGETGHGSDRIVRIGIATKPTATVFKRINTHFYGKKDNSIFRRQIGRVILRDDSERLANWNIKRERNGYKPDYETEEKVSSYLAENCCFIAVAIEDIKKVEELEKKMIATVAQCDECKPSTKWFGHGSPQKKVRDCGLWQEQGLHGGKLSNDDLAEIAKHLIKA